MNDSKGNPLSVGDRCEYFGPQSDGGTEYVGRFVTVRKFEPGRWDNTRIDDGEPGNPSLWDNGARWAAWVGSAELTKIEK